MASKMRSSRPSRGRRSNRRRSGNAMKSVSVAYIEALVADLRDYLGGAGRCNVFGVCGDAAYFLFDFLRKRLPDIHVVYGDLAWVGQEPFAHWWNKSEKAGLIMDVANPFVARGHVGPLLDPRYRERRTFQLTKKQLSELEAAYDGLSLDPNYYRRFAP